MICRRDFCKVALAATGLLLGSCASKPRHKRAKVLIIGGGFGGATVAKYLRKLNPYIEITLITAQSNYQSCPSSNWVYGGVQTVDNLAISYAIDSKYAVRVVNAYAVAIDPSRRVVTLHDNATVPYDRLVVAPGVDFRWDTIIGYSPTVAKIIPHAWQGNAQTALLHRQLLALPDRATVLIYAPPNPYKCPPGPYERASMIAHYLKTRRRGGKVIIVDPKRRFAKQELFISGWEKHYGYGTANSLIEWLPTPDNRLTHLDAKNRTITCEFGDRYHADLLNIIPPQKAAAIAQPYLTDSSGWCPVYPTSFESKLQPNIHVIGDAAMATPLPKSAMVANAQAKVCAVAIACLLEDLPIPDPVWINTCYSLITPSHGISVAMVYQLNQQGQIGKVKGSGGLTAQRDTAAYMAESTIAKNWYKRIIADSFS